MLFTVIDAFTTRRENMHYNEITRSENHRKDALLLPLRDP